MTRSLITSHRSACAMLLAVAALASAACGDKAELAAGGDPVVASYRGGTLTESELEGWRKFRPMMTSERTEKRYGFETAEMAAVVKAGAELARAQSLGAGRQDLFYASRDEAAILSEALKADVIAGAPIDQATVDALFVKHDGERQKPERRRLRMLLKRVAPGGDAAARERVRAEVVTLREEVLAGADFAELAKRESHSQTRHQGGLLGTFPRTALPPALAEAAFELAEGGVSEVLESAQGYAFLLCESITPARVMPREEALQRIEDAVRREAGDRLWRELATSLVSDSVEHNFEALANPEGAPDEVVSRWQGGELTRQEVEWLMERGAESLDVGAQPRQAIGRMLNTHARHALTADEARKRGLHQTPASVQRIAWSRRAALMKAYRSREVEALFVAPSEQQVRSFFEQNPERFATRPRYRLAVLWDGSPSGERADRYVELQDAVAKIALGELSFAQAAATLSSHPRANAEGELGWRARRDVGGWGPAALRAVEALAVGEVSAVIEEPAALWVFKLLDKEEARPRSWDEAKDRAREHLEQQMRASLHVELMKRLLVEWDVEVVRGASVDSREAGS